MAHSYSNSSRRDLFKKMILGSIGFSPIASFAAKAFGPSSFTKNYVQLNLMGAPSRWLFDSILKPSAESKVNGDRYVIDRFDGKNFSYSPQNASGLFLPLVWDLPFTDSKGRTRTAKDLLPYWGSVRGVQMLNPGHSFNNRRLVAPVPGGYSFSGQIADRSATPLASVGWEPKDEGSYVAPSAFRSENGSGTLSIPFQTNNPMDFIFRGIGTSVSKKESVDLLTDLIEAEQRKNFSKMPDFREQRRKARKLIEFAGEAYVQEFETIYQKYAAIERQAIHGQHSLLTSFAIPGMNFSSRTNLKSAKDACADYNHLGFALESEDLRESLNKARFVDNAYKFALAEFLLKHELSQSLVLCFNALTGLSLKGPAMDELSVINGQLVKKSSAGKRSQVATTGFDAHFVGSVPNFLYTSIFFHSLSACMVEFVDFLKEKNIFDQTWLHVASEFEREPNQTGSGSEHGIHGHVSSFFNGCIKGPFVVGNIRQSSEGTGSLTESKSTWGHGAAQPEIEQGFLTYENIASSISDVLGLPSLSPNKASLFKKENGQITSILGPAKNNEA